PLLLQAATDRVTSVTEARLFGHISCAFRLCLQQRNCRPGKVLPVEKRLENRCRLERTGISHAVNPCISRLHRSQAEAHPTANSRAGSSCLVCGACLL